MLVFAAYAIVQVTQLADATPTFGVYDSDNYPVVGSPYHPAQHSSITLTGMLIWTLHSYHTYSF